MHTLVSVGMIGPIVKIVEKPGVATTVASKDTWPAISRRIDHHLEEESIEDRDQARLEEIQVETARDNFHHAPRVENGPRRPEERFGRPGGGCP